MLKTISIVLAVCAVILGGCAQLTDSQRYDLANTAYVETTETIIRLSERGVIGLDELEDYNRIRVPISAMLDRIDEQLQDGQEISGNTWERLDYLLDAAYSALGESQ